ncbi:Ig-like domain-containing protein [Planctomycetota bacterium]
MRNNRCISILCLLFLLTAVLHAETVVVVVNKDLKPFINTELTRLVNDIDTEGHTVTVKEWDPAAADQNSPAELKAYLESVSNLNGAVFIGTLPVANFRHANDFGGATVTFPCDFYYMDINNTWNDTNSDGYFDQIPNTPVGSIWVSRVKASNMGGMFSGLSEAELTIRYLNKNHRFRTGELRLADKGLQWSDTDWQGSTPSSLGLASAYTDTLRVTEAVTGITTDRADWMGRWYDDYETEYFQCHSSATLHAPGGSVYNYEVADGDIKRLFWNCWNCSSGKYTSANYIAGCRMFTMIYGLTAIASTKTGSMLPYYGFYNHLGDGKTHGYAFKEWFSYNASTYNTDDEYIGWRFGMTLLGDGTLKLGRHTSTINDTNDPPSADDDSYSTNENVLLSVDMNTGVIQNDSDPDANVLTADLVTDAGHGTLTLNADGSFSYDPDTDWAGIDTFVYRVYDGTVYSGNATVTITVVGISNNAPDAVNDSAATSEDVAVDINVLANDTDADGDTLDVTSITQGTDGTVTINADDTVKYTPDADFNGTDSFTYTISDGNGGTDTATVTVTVTSINDAPNAGNDSATTPEDTAKTIDVLANDTDPDGDTLSVGSVTQPANGSVTNNTTNVTYTPDADFNGVDTFTYTASDGNGGTDTATVTVTVTSVNDAPNAVNDSATTAEDTSKTINVLANDTDPDGDTLSVDSVTQPANGSVANNGSNVTYTPDGDFHGTDIFTYTASDGNGGTDTATVTITVTSVNDAPNAVNDAASTPEDTAKTIDVLANDTDPDGDTLTVSAVTQPANGSVANNTSNVTYTPDGGFNGTDAFTYTITDGNGGTDTATVTVTVSGTNDPPDAVNDSASTPEDTAKTIDVLANDTDPDGDTLTVGSVTQPSNGSVANNSSNVTYTPDANFHGTDIFTYTASDGNGGIDTATVTVTVTSVNDDPNAVNDSATTAEDTAKTIDVLVNDTDPDGDILSVDSVTQPANGTVTNNTTDVTYTPDAGFNGVDTFTYTASDGNGGTDTAIVTVTVTGANDPPDAVNDSATTAEDTPVDIDVLANDTDPDGDTLTVDSVTQPSNGTVTNNTTDVTYTPELDFEGSDSFTYTVSDGNGGTDTATVTVTVTGENDAPTAIDQSVTVVKETAKDITLEAADPDGDTLTYIIVDYPSNGTLSSDDGDETVTYTPDAGYSGSDSFTFKANDGTEDSNTAAVSLEIGDTLVRIISVSTGQNYSLAQAVVGQLYYIDRSYTIEGISANLEGNILVRTANNDKKVKKTEHLTLELGAEAVVSVCYDPRGTILPAWLDDGTWALTGEQVDIPSKPGSPLQVYEKTFPAGQLTLGGNMAAPAEGAKSTYIVIIRSASGPGAAVYEEGPVSAGIWKHKGDTDGDGLYDFFEKLKGLKINHIDTDIDTLVDEEEKSYWEEQENFEDDDKDKDKKDFFSGCMYSDGPVSPLSSAIILIMAMCGLLFRRKNR